jgi:hypothetical protein
MQERGQARFLHARFAVAGPGHPTVMASATEMGQAGLQGWREKVADVVSEPVAKRAPLEEDQVRAAIGAVFFVLSVMYVFKTVTGVVKQARES